MDITIQPVMWKLDDTLRQQIVSFWVEHGAMSAETATERVKQVLQVARQGEGGPIIGVCTAYVQYIDSLRLPLYMYRTFVANGTRSQGTAHRLFLKSFELLNKAYSEGRLTEACGVMLEIENDWLKARGGLVWHEDYHLTFVGYG